MSSTSAVFVGSGSLLIRCAQAFVDAGHVIRCIATDNAEIAQWACARNIETVAIEADSHISIPPVDFDYLFSVENLHILPSSLFARARKLAINFHDGPLPRYAGLNATSWALMAQETAYGITWHEMTSAVDQGRIVRQALFPVAPAETALSLNARCYEAGLAAFVSIVRDLAQGDLELTAQSGPRQYFGRAQRPDALATLDF